MTSATPTPDTRRCRVLARNLTLAAVAAVLAAGVVPSAAGAAPKPAASVCNEAENSWQGGYSVTADPVDPNPPPFLRGSQMRVGNSHGAGLENAAEQSPALRLCGPDGSGDGGDDGGVIILI